MALRVLAATFLMLMSMSGSAQPLDLVTAHGRDFALNGQSFRFVGVNLRGLVHYGMANPLQYTTKGDIAYNLDGVAGFGGKVVRIFAANTFFNNATNIANLEDVLDELAARNMKALVCLTDVYNTAFHPQGDDSYYVSVPGGYTMLSHAWFTSGYQVNYLPWLQATVGALKNHSAVFAWEIGNELTDVQTPSGIIAFTESAAAAIKAIDGYHMVTTGFLSVDHLQIGEAAARTLYEDDNIDFISVHSYNGDDPFQNWATHARVEKPLIVGEYGWENSAGNRVTNTQAQVDKWFDTRLARGFLQWGYQYNTVDIGDGDSRFGMDRNFFAGDYAAYASIYGTRATDFANNPLPLGRVGPPAGINVARTAPAWATDSNYAAANDADKAIDGIISEASKWTSNGNPAPHWIALDLGAPYTLGGMTVRSAADAGEFVFFGFKAFELQTAPALAGPWTTQRSYSNPNQIAAYHAYFSPVLSAQYVRLLITDTGIDNYARLPEWELFGPTAGAESWELY